MKPVVAFYTACLILLYSILTFIGYRKENFGNPSEGILPEVVISATPDKTEESKILGQHFNNVLYSIQKKQNNLAADQVYDALMVFAYRSVSSGNYNKDQFRTIVNNLSNCYVALKLNRPVSVSTLKENFESAELFIAEQLVLRSSADLENNDFQSAIEDLKQAEESIGMAAKYSALSERETEEGIINGSRQFLNKIIQTRRTKSNIAYLKYFWYKITEEGRAI